MDPVALDALRRASKLRLDRDGQWWHDGERVEHPRIRDLFDRGLSVDESGDVRLVLGTQWAFVAVDETAFVVRRARDVVGGAIALALNDGTEEHLDASTLQAFGDRELYCLVKGGRFPARFLRAAYHHVADRLRPAPAGGGYVYEDADGVHVVLPLAERPRHGVSGGASRR